MSGNPESLERIREKLEAKGAVFWLLDLDYAFHSRQMDIVEENLAERLKGLSPSSSGSVAFVSTVTGDVVDGVSLNAGYWWRNIREPVRFADAMEKLADLGCRIFVEIGPHAILQRYMRENLSAVGVKGRVLAALHRNNDGMQRVVETALRINLLAASPQMHTCFPYPARHTPLPNYPWQKEHHWHPRSSEGLLSVERRRIHPLLGWRLHDAEAVWENTLDPSVLPWLADHRVGGAIVYPGTAYAEMALVAAREWLGSEHLIVEELNIVSPMVFDDDHGRILRFLLNPRDREFQIKSRERLSTDEWTLHATGRLPEATNRIPAPCIKTPEAGARQFDRETHYRSAVMMGLEYGAAFQGLQGGKCGRGRLEARLETDLFSEDYILHPALLDVCFQSLVDFFSEEIETGRGMTFLPVKIGRLDLYHRGKASLFRAQIQKRGSRSVLADFELLDNRNRLVARVSGCRFRAVHFKRHDQAHISSWSVVPWLKPHPADGMRTELPSVSDLAVQARTRIDGIRDDRQTWFRETLPLIEALVLSFACEAYRTLLHESPQDQQWLQSSAYARWLTELLKREGMLQQDGLNVAVGADLPSVGELWQAVLRDSPSCLSQLALIGRVGRQLPFLLSGKSDGRELHRELRHSPVAEALYNDDPAYLGGRLALEGALHHLASGWPTSRRLRILEISDGFSELPKTLVNTHLADRLDYVLALPDEAMKVRQQAEYQNHVGVNVTVFDAFEWIFPEDQELPDTFDVVILGHTLHRAANPDHALSQARCRLASGGILMVIERYPDWSTDFIEGVDPDWWRESREEQGEVVSSLRSPNVWRQALINGGFAECESFVEPDAEGLSEGVYLLFASYQTDDTPVLPLPAAASWLFLADEFSAPLANSLRQRLDTLGHHVVVSDHAEASFAGDHVVHMLGWNDPPDAASDGVMRLSEDVQRYAARPGKPPRLWLITRGGALVSGPASGHRFSPAQSALWGFCRVLMNEFPQLSCTLIDLTDACPAPDMSVRLENELLRPDGSNEIMLSLKKRYCLVMREDVGSDMPTTEESERFRLDFHVPGQLRSLVWLAETERVLRDDEIEVCTKAAGLNFRDVMYLMGLLPDEAVENGFAGASLGLEFSGVVSRIGAGVKDLQPGDAVVGFGASCFASHIVTRADAVARMPKDWTFEAAATIPTVFFTVYYALRQLADIQPGERILIHGAAGGVGIAAIQLAQHLGAEIYATAGNSEKRDFVRLLGADHVFDSRSLSFVDDVLAVTANKGVDVVLNSLAGEAMRQSLGVLRPFGRFLELGKRDFFENTPIGLSPFKNNISYFGIDADQLLTGRPRLAARLFHDVMELFHEDILTPLPYRTFTADRIVDAFRVMQQARHIGKIVISLEEVPPDIRQQSPVQPEFRFEKGRTWLVTGGLSGFGMESAEWLVAHGVDNLVLAGRRGPETPGAKQIVEAYAAQGVKVSARACDITDAGAVDELVEHIKTTMPPLDGILHAAAVFDDRLISGLDARSIESVLEAKLTGAWNLHQATLDMPLEYFILYSSVTTAIGNPGQANYVAANAGIEGLAAMRRHMGLPAICVSWGPIGDAGYLVRNEAVKDSLEQRLGKPPVAACEALKKLNQVFAGEERNFTFANFDWNTLSRLLPSAATTRFDLLNRGQGEPEKASEAIDIRTLIANKSAEEIIDIVRGVVIQEIGQTLSMNPERIELNRSLHDLGMDSLMAVELALGLERRLDIQMPVMMLNDAPTVDKVVGRIAEKLTGTNDEANDGSPIAGLIRQHGENMTTEELDNLARDARKLAESEVKLTA